MIRFSKYISMAFLLILSACVRPQGHPADDTATFVVDSVTGRSEVSKQIDGFSIPRARQFNFTACVSDRRSQEKIRRGSFEVHGAAKAVSQRTDDAGCLNWTEEIPYNHLADEKYLTLERTIRSTGMQTGSRTIQVAINPWGLTKAQDVVDLTRGQTPEDATLSAKDSIQYMSVQSEKPLWISKIAIDNRPESRGNSVIRRLRVSIQPSVLLKDLRGQISVYPLAAAKLQASVELQALVTTGGQEHVFSVDKAANLPLVQDGDLFRFDFVPTLKNGNANTRYQLGVKLNAIGAPRDLKGFDGVFSIGDYASLTGAPILPVLLKDGKAEKSVVVPISSGVSSSVSSGVSSGVSQPKVFEVGEIRLDWVGVEAETALDRQVAFRASVCITDTANGNRPATDTDFTIEVGSGAARKSVKVQKRHGPGTDGCISWDDSIQHRYYDVEHFIEIPVAIRHAASGFVETRVLGFNPWDRIAGGADMKTARESFDKLNQRQNKVPARLINETFGWETVNNRQFGVDEFMNLKVTKTIQFRVPMRVQRFSNILSGRQSAAEPLRDGIYGFRAIMFIPVRGADGQITEVYSPIVGEYRLVKVISGDVKVQVDIDLSDARLMKARGTIAFEILPVDEARLSEKEKSTLTLEKGRRYQDVIDRQSGLVTPTFAGPIFAGDESSFSVTFPTDIVVTGGVKGLTGDTRAIAGRTFDELLERAHKSHDEYLKRMREARSLSGFLKNANLEYVSLNNESIVMAQNPGLAENNIGLPKAQASQRFMSYLNYQFKKGLLVRLYDMFPQAQPVSLSDAQAIVEGRKELDKATAGRLCMLLMNDVVGPALATPKTFFNECLKELARDFAPGGTSGNKVFAIDRSVRLIETDGGQSIPTNMPSLSFNVGADVSFSRSNSHSYSASASWSPSGIIDLATKPFPLLSSVWGVLGLSASFTHARSDSTTVNEGSSFSTGQSLSMEHVAVGFTAVRYERCMTVRVRPDFWEARKSNLKDAKLKGEALLNRLSRGVFICTGFENRQPLKLRENFYTFAQGAFDGFRVDKGDLGNHPYLISLRGTTDYLTFLNLIAAKKSSASQVTETFKVGGFPIDRVSEAYQQYRAHLPSQPGLYTFEPVSKIVPEAEPTLPWWGYF
jgi:hypothetical protein